MMPAGAPPNWPRENLAIIRSGQTVTTAEQQGDLLWAEASWQERERPDIIASYSFSMRGSSCSGHRPVAPIGDPATDRDQPWGTLSLTRADAAYRDHH